MKIRPLKQSDKEQLLCWSNNQELWGFILRNRFVNEIEHEKFFNDLCFDKTREYFILENENSTIGLCGLREIDFMNDKAELFIYIAEDKYRNKGFGQVSMQFIIDYGFKNLGLHKLSLRVVEGNNALKLYENNGFKIDGVLREEFKMNQSYKNVYIMSLLSSEVEDE